MIERLMVVAGAVGNAGGTACVGDAAWVARFDEKVLLTRVLDPASFGWLFEKWVAGRKLNNFVVRCNASSV
jgi:hypothetical protein